MHINSNHNFNFFTSTLFCDNLHFTSLSDPVNFNEIHPDLTKFIKFTRFLTKFSRFIKTNHTERKKLRMPLTTAQMTSFFEGANNMYVEETD